MSELHLPLSLSLLELGPPAHCHIDPLYDYQTLNSSHAYLLGAPGRWRMEKTILMQATVDAGWLVSGKHREYTGQDVVNRKAYD